MLRHYLRVLGAIPRCGERLGPKGESLGMLDQARALLAGLERFLQEQSAGWY